MPRNPTRAEKIAFKEQMQRGQGFDLEPKSDKEIQSQKKCNSLAKENDEEIRLSGSQNQQYFRENSGLGSPPNYDNYDDESFP